MLTVYGMNNREKWDSIVRSFAEYDVYYLSGYARAFQLHGDGEPILIYYEEGSTRAINVVMKRDISKDHHFAGKIENGKLFDFSTPYGYGGWLIEGDNIQELDKEYVAWCEKENVVSEFVRFSPTLGNQNSDMYEVVPLSETVTMDLTSPEVIWSNITSKNRNVIRKAIKNNVRIFNGRYPEIMGKFHEIYDSTMDKDSADDYYYFKDDFYESIINDLPENAEIFYADLNGKVIAAAIMLGANGRLNYHLSGSVREYSSLAATNLLLYKAALWGSAQGYKTFHLGGGVGSKEDSLFKFKKAFYRGELTRFCIGKKIMKADTYNELVMMRDDLPESGFFPRYRAWEISEL
ncbi:MAG: GNAT family N-acetyltransferase [Clostridiales bacterium]|nr:GNAT family N-acetyltransferase [Clostridiales bacterium]